MQQQLDPRQPQGGTGSKQLPATMPQHQRGTGSKPSPALGIKSDALAIAADINIWWAEIRTSFPLVFFSRVRTVKQALISTSETGQKRVKVLDK